MSNESPTQKVEVTDIRMRFGSMVLFMVKFAIASIPALVILVALGTFFWAVILGLLSPLKRHESFSPAGVSAPRSQRSEASPAGETLPSWRVQTSTSAMDGSKMVALQLDSDSEFPGSFGMHRATLVLRCKEKKTEAYIVTGTRASVENTEETHAVRLRFDQAEPVTEHWSESTSGDTLFARNGRQLIDRLVKADVLTFEFTPFDAGPAVVRFALNGLGDRLPELAQACGWSDKGKPKPSERQSFVEQDNLSSFNSAQDVLTTDSGAEFSVQAETADKVRRWERSGNPQYHCPLSISCGAKGACTIANRWNGETVSATLVKRPPEE